MKSVNWSKEEQAYAHLSGSPIGWIVNKLAPARVRGTPLMAYLLEYRYEDLFNIDIDELHLIAKKCNFIPPGEDMFTFSHGAFSGDGCSLYYDPLRYGWVLSSSSAGIESVIAISDDLNEIERKYLTDQMNYLRNMLNNNKAKSQN
ncbi:MAG: hypothetical protein WC661_00580 [Opitutaceae bacterium]|jgi:hypothetical protein